jgi:hypothetical protein
LTFTPSVHGVEGAGDLEIEQAHADEAAIAPKAEPATRECLCGCGTLITSKRSRFAPGHDSKLHAMVRKIDRGEATLDAIPDRKETRDYLITAGWMSKHPNVLAQLQGQPLPVAEPAHAAEIAQA